MDTGDHWKARIAKFNNSICQSMFMDESMKNDILLDILQDLFSENIKEDVRIQFLLFIEENIYTLMTNLDSAEQSFGSLKNFFCNSLGNHLILLKCQVLVTMTTLVITFDFKKEKKHLYQSLLEICLDLIFKVNTGHSLIRKTCSQCLLMIEQSDQGSLSEYTTNMLATAKGERSFVSYDHMVLLASVVYGVDQLLKSNTEEKDISHIQPPDINKCISFLFDQSRNLSPTGLVQVILKLLPCLESRKAPKALMNDILTYSFQSWDFLVIYLSFYTHLNYSLLLQQQYSNNDPVMTLIVKLLLANSMEQFPLEYSMFMQYWLRGSFKNLSPSVQQNAVYLVFSHLTPNIHKDMSSLPATLDTIVSITKHNKIELPHGVQSNFLELVLKQDQHFRTTKDISAFFHTLFNLYLHGDVNARNSILKYVENIAVTKLKLVSYIIDFCKSIEAVCESKCSIEVLRRIMLKLLTFNLREILQNFRHYLFMVEFVASFKEIWPVAIIEKILELVQLPMLQTCSWSDGSLLLSVCKSILISNGDKTLIKHGVASILWQMSQNMIDCNLSDRALFYYSIIGNLSPKYYGQVLVSPSSSRETVGMNVNEVREAMNSGLPSMYNVKKNFLSFNMINKKGSSTQFNNKIFYDPNERLLQTYRHSLQLEHYDKSVTKIFELSFNTGTECVDDDDDDIPNEIYAVYLKITCDGPYEKIPGITCSYLNNSFQNKSEDIMHELGEVVTLRFIPSRPCSSQFDIRASFTDGENKCWLCDIPSYTLEFSHLMQKLPYVENKPEECLLFDELWEDIKSNQKSIDNPSFRNALSVKSLGNVGRKALLGRLEEFVCEESDDILKFGIYLPPCNHMLLMASFENKSTLVKIAVDDFTLFDHIDKFLNSIAIV